MADDDAGFLSRWSKRKAQVRVGVAPAEPAVSSPPVVAPAPAPLVRPQPAAGPMPGQPAEAAPPGAAPLPALDKPPLPTLDDVALLTHASDYSRFVAPGVDARVSNAAMKKLFTDPHFNVMDRLDTYIDDYGLPDPIPESMLRQMVQSKFLGLFDHEEKDAAAEQAAKDAAAGRAVATDVDPNAAATADANANANTSAAAGAEAGADTAAVHAEPAALAMNLSVDPDENTDLQLQPNDAAGPAGADQGARPRPV